MTWNTVTPDDGARTSIYHCHLFHPISILCLQKEVQCLVISEIPRSGLAAQALKVQFPMRRKILSSKQDQALSGCNQEAAAVGIWRLHQLEKLNSITVNIDEL